ncbi:TPA: hypothetical protein TVO00_001660 [Streptococcus equi subsp. zooepidemicus]|nr:hypothetical protein [Streptococcus equi subsp. zooepidemicus]HEL0595842.1 hypothetical protein [Streptococcus equi subsp. zooepidemicus]HEL0817382.1 hypothetical protein [Streptococcus equi subsp. zooepidemicus]HEL1251169.1 hypothetical protein [Streptococcus equi subsp. zooepidemicus]HEL1298661.1 hypothetical protein [Streptococcus equi subsp. zooepidemicus]
MNETMITTLISVGATVLTNLIINGFTYFQKRLELKHNIEEKQLDFRNTQSKEDRDRFISTFQDFASISGKTVSYVDSRNANSPAIELEIITNFDDIFYKTYLFLENNDDRKKFITFRNILRHLAGYPHPEGKYVWDLQLEEEMFDPEVIEEPRYIFDRLNDCLLIVNKYIANRLQNQSSIN